MATARINDKMASTMVLMTVGGVQSDDRAEAARNCRLRPMHQLRPAADDVADDAASSTATATSSSSGL